MTEKKKPRHETISSLQERRKTNTTSSFGVFTEDISIAEQEIVLEDRKGKKIRKPTKGTKTNDSSSDSDGRQTLSSSTTLVPPYSGRRTFSPTFTLTGSKCPF